MPKSTISRDILLAALAGFQLDKQRIDLQIAEVQALLDGGGSQKAALAGSAESPKTGRRKRSPAVRRRMAEAQRARWAAVKGISVEPKLSTAKPAKSKRKMSAAGRKAISDATKKRWALKRAGETKSTPSKTASKKAGIKSAAD